MNRIFDRSSDRECLDVIIIGAGMGGLGAAVKLTQAGVERIAILEKTDGLGGVWLHNRYPNVACDTPIDLYAYSFFLGSRWTSNFAPGAEILEYLREFAAAHNVDRFMTFNTEIAKAVWNAADNVWEVTSSDGRRWKSRYVVWSGGLLSNPAVPQLRGLERFRGEMFHTARWPDSVDFRDKRVGVVGGGASAIQVVPYVADNARESYSFVRTPSYVLPRPDVIYTVEERSSPEFFVSHQKRRRQEWFERFEFIAKARFPMNTELIEQQEAEWRKHFDRYVSDPKLREILTPKYRFGCKRPLFSNLYYQAVTHPAMTVVGDGISEVFADGLIDNRGNKYDLDVIVWATGYDASHMMGALDIVGTDGRHLRDFWSDIPSAYYGSMVKGFPNLFLVGGPNVGGASQSDFIEAQLWLILQAMRMSDERGAVAVEVSEEAFDRFNENIQARARESVLIRGNCTSWYLSSKTGGVFSHWPGTIQAFQSGVRHAAFSGLDYCSSRVIESVADEA